jgi:hypothetical protein
MRRAVLASLASWQSFYVIIGAAAATLTGLMFIVITLIAGVRGRASSASHGVAAFSTPNVVHFCAALLLAAMLSAPWPKLWQASSLVGACGLVGGVYVGTVLRKTRRGRSTYALVLEDWLGHIVGPFIAYAALAVAAVVLPTFETPALFVIAAAMLTLLFVGVHNAWDTITYLTLNVSEPEQG